MGHRPGQLVSHQHRRRRAVRCYARPFPLLAAAGFSYADLQPVRQVTAPSLAAAAATFRRESHTPLMLITDSAYHAGLARLRAAAVTEQGPVTDTLDLLVLRAAA